jgi:peptidoglycan/xylan/chitin deacetylase (PgdA/CDA1 family)
MKIVSPFLKKVLYPSLSAAGIFRRSSAPGLAVVTYHGVLPNGYSPIEAGFDGNLVTAETLRRQLRMLKSNYHVITPEQALGWRKGQFDLPPRAVLITCDDGLRNNLTHMLPVLQQEQVRCLFFVTGASTGELRRTLWYEELFLLFHGAAAGHFEASFDAVSIRVSLESPQQRRAAWWDSVKRLSQLDAETRCGFLQSARRQTGMDVMKAVADGDSPASCRFGLMTVRELRALAEAGMTIGAHTMSHPVLSQMQLQMARAEIVESRAALEAALQMNVWAFAYPFGDAASVTPEVLAVARDAGYELAFLNFGGGLGTPLPRLSLPRVHVTSDMSVAELEAHVCGFHARLQRGTGRNMPAFEPSQE